MKKRQMIGVALALSILLCTLASCERQEPEKPVNEKPEEQVSEKTLYPVPEYYYPQYAWCQGYSIYDYEGPWYLETTCDQLLEFSIYPHIELTEFQKDYVIKVPKEYSTEIEGITYTLNFFQEYYEYNDLIQFKYTITNHTGEPLEFAVPELRGDFYNTHNNQSLGRLYLLKIHAGWEIDSHYGPDLLEDGATTTKARTTEEIYYADPTFFHAGGSYEFKFRFVAHTVTFEHVDGFESKTYEHSFSLPVEVVLRDQVTNS